MSATVAIAASAVAISASNSAQIAEQKRDMCKLYVEGFDSKGASVQSQKHYAECVQLLNPEPMTHNQTLGLKAGIIVLLIAAVVGTIWGILEGDGFTDKLMMAMCGFLLGASMVGVVILVGILVGIGVGFLFS